MREDEIMDLLKNASSDTARALAEMAFQLARIAVQLEKITSLKYTEDA